jgi:2-polyprenyl-6-methoxyphenol hydroxylase-like FAD-dependent oxidoreductase
MREEIVKSLSVEKSMGKSPFSLGTPFVAMKRSRLDSILLQRAIRNGATFLQATALDSIGGGINSIEDWLLSLRSAERGSGHNVYCKYLIGADGRNSRVASLLRPIGKRRSEEIEGESRRVGVQFTVARPDAVEGSVTMFFFKGGYGGIVGVTAEEANVAMVTTQELSSLAIMDFGRFIERTIHANKFAREAFSSLVLTGKVSSASPITPRRNRVAHPRAFLVGDARHTAEPFTGQGTFFALQDGVTTARRIADSLGYSSERPKIGTTSHLTVNRFFSPILRGERWVDTLLNIGGRFEGVARMVARSVIS